MNKNKIKIVEMISSLSVRGGAETFFFNLVNSMSLNKSIDLYVIVLYDNLHESFSYLKNNYNIKLFFLGKHKGVDFSCANKLKKIFNKIEPNIVNVHLSCLLTYILAFGRKKQKFKLFHTAHNIREPSDKFIKFLSKKNLIYIIAISDLVYKRIKKDFSKANSFVIYNGIPLNNYFYIKQKKYDFICVAQFRKQKNHKLLIDAFNLFCQENKPSTLILIGEGDLEIEIREYAKKTKYNDYIYFLGGKNDVYPFLLQSKYFILSSHYEGNPISILEAMNAYLPIIAPAVGGIPDIVKDNVNGFLCSPESCIELSNAMKRCVDSDSNYIGQFNHNYVKQFSIERCSDNYIKLFDKFI